MRGILGGRLEITSVGDRRIGFDAG